MADSILLLPHPEHREALLGDSPGGGKAPIRRVGIAPWSGLWTLADSADVQWNEPDRPYDDFDAALVLRWRGVNDVMGCDRAQRLAWQHGGVGRFRIAAGRLRASYTTCQTQWIAAQCDQCGLGRIVHLDADGREVTP